MKLRATFSFQGFEAEITQQILRDWMSDPLAEGQAGRAVLLRLLRDGAQVLTTTQCEALCRLSVAEFASLFTLHDE